MAFVHKNRTPKHNMVVQENARLLGARVTVREADALHRPADSGPWHIIVGNPPYIAHGERTAMHLPRTDYAANADDNEIVRRFWGHGPVARAAALFFYEAGSEVSRVIFRMKYHNHPEVGEILGTWVAREASRHNFFDGIDAIVPVPLSKRRERQRGYNQSREIAKGVSAVTGLPIMDRVLVRRHFKESQTRQSMLGRRENVADAFSLHPKAPSLEGKHLLIIDDIVTTGATVTACIEALGKPRGMRVSVLSIGAAK